MKLLINIITYFCIPVCLFAQQYRPLPVDKDGKLSPASKFVSANSIVQTTNLSVFVDLYRDGIDDTAGINAGRSVYWSDCELKVLDKNGKIVYFFSTIAFASRQVQELHEGAINDTGAIVYYYVSGGNSSNGVCVKPKKRLTNFNLSIGAIETAHDGISTANDNKVRITAIQIYPSAKFREVFLNPENSIMVWRQSINSAETDGKGGKCWRPAIIQFIR